MDPTAQPCSHRLHSAATLERRSHCLVAPAVPLLVVIGTGNSGHYINFFYQDANDRKLKEKRKQGTSRQGWKGRGRMSLLLGTLPGKSLVPQRSFRSR